MDSIPTSIFPLSKSQFQLYRACPAEFWYDKHQPDRFYTPLTHEQRHLLEQGQQIDRLARGYFTPNDQLDVDFQSTFISEFLLARTDILLTDRRKGEVRLVEVKSGTDLREEYIIDAAFQVIAAAAAGLWVQRQAILYVDKRYLHIGGDIDVQRFFVCEDVTERVRELLPLLHPEIEGAIAYLCGPEPHLPLHHFCGKKLDCPVLRHCNPGLPDYSIFELRYIRHAQLAELIERNVLDIRAIPDDFRLSERQWAQVRVACSGEATVRHEVIAAQLAALQYPLYFLDYESVQPAFPFHAGLRPYEHVVFQWSLHVVAAPGAEPAHHEFLSESTNSPSFDFVRTLHAAIPSDGGTVVVWNKSFETTRNRELAARFPEYADFLLDLNARIYDLMEVFQQQHYLHAAFRGSYSLKTVLPVLVPGESYNDLVIRGGKQASVRWYEAVQGRAEATVFEDLRAYCKMDTWAMVAIWRVLGGGVGEK